MKMFRRVSYMDIIFKTQNYEHLNWNDRSRFSSGTAGCFLKTYEHDGSKRIYYKLSNYDSYRGIFGHESVNEVIASRLLERLNIEHVVYRLINADIIIDGKKHNTWMCSSKNFKKSNEQKTGLDTYYDISREENESPEDFCARMGWSIYIYKMMVADFLMCNRDRHGANIEVLFDPDGNVRLAPLFDHGISFLFSCYSDEKQIREFDVLKDRQVNNYLYTRSLQENLRFIPDNFEMAVLTESDLDLILKGINRIIPEYHVEQIRKMIWERWKIYEQIRNS